MSETIKIIACPQCGTPIPAEAPQGLCPKCVLGGAAHPTEAGARAATATEEIPTISRIAAAFSQLEIIELIGRGGMGFVFKARQPHLDRYVALKLLPDKLATDPQFAERFGREGRVLAKLNHPNIVSVFDFGQAGGFYYLLMEYIDGVNLRQAMRAGRFSPGEALAIVPKICEALQYAHEQGVLHRDIKPENILLDAKGRVKIADFGIAKLVGEDPGSFTLTATGAALGTPHYMAPEQLEKPTEVDHRADIYSLGVVFYEMLTGELPIGRFAAPSAKTPIDQRVDEIVFRALEKERELRQQNATEFKTQVESVSARTPTDPAAGSHTTSAPWKRWLRPAAWILVVLLAINFFGLHVTRLGNDTEPTWTLGLKQPWLANVPDKDEHGVVYREFETNFRSSSFRSGILAVILTAGLIVFRKASRRTDAPRLSVKAIWAAMLVGLSLPLPIILVLAAFTVGRIGTGEMLLALYTSLLPAIIGTVLGWVAVMELHSQRSRLSGLPLALFAALAWPSLIFAGVTLVLPWGILRAIGVGETRSVAGTLLFFLPAGTLTFLIWAIYATARWASGKPADHRRGVLKWIFTALLLSGIGVTVMMSQGRRNASAGVAANNTERDTKPSITFTITAVELREAAGERWMAIDYLDDVQGNAEKVFMRDSDIPGFKSASRTSEFVGGNRAKPIRHQRVEFLMPKTASREQLERFRSDVAKALNQKSFTLTVGEEKALFDFSPAEGGSLKARITVIPPPKVPVVATPPAKSIPFRQIELSVPTSTNDSFRNVSVTTESPLRDGEYLVALTKRPDGRIQEQPAVTTVFAGSGQPRVMHHLLWAMNGFESNRVRDIVFEAHKNLNERVAELAVGERWRVFAATNDRGQVVEGYFTLRSAETNRANDLKASVTVVEKPQAWPFFVSTKVKISAPPGYSPRAIGRLGDGSETEAHTSIMRIELGEMWSGDHCAWYFPRDFQPNDVQEIVRQLETTQKTWPNGITLRPNSPMPMFSVTNQAGTVLRGFLELPVQSSVTE